MHASDLALEHAGLNLNPKDITKTDSETETETIPTIGGIYLKSRFGVAIASGIGAIHDIVEGQKAFEIAAGGRKLSPYFVPKVLANMAGGYVSIRHGLQGPNHSVSTACAAGAHAIVELCMHLAEGNWDRSMSAVRLSALYKTAERTLEATRPVACGESERRTVGSAMVAVVAV